MRTDRAAGTAIVRQGAAVGAEVTDEELTALYGQAVAARAVAYAPYSGFAVGAAVLADDADVVVGGNVENASYGLSQCGERVTLGAAVAAGIGPGRPRAVRALAIAGPEGVACPPCGACRQWIVELAGAAVVVFRDADGLLAVGAHDLLPHAFDLGQQP